MKEPRIVNMEPKRLAGLSVEMSYSNNLTGQVWGQFMPKRKEIEKPISQDKYSVQIFRSNFDWYKYSADTQFVKWATMEIDKKGRIPEGMDTLQLTGGLYAVFVHKGLATQFYSSLQFILNEWLPASDYEPDYFRPQFEVLGDKYKNNDPASEEEIWFPIVKK